VIARGETRGRHQRRIWVREILSPAEAKADYPRLWEVAEALVPGLTEDEFSRVISLVVDTCSWCYRSDRSCRCRGGDAAPQRSGGQRQRRL
jgi:hypothetical protein